MKTLILEEGSFEKARKKIKESEGKEIIFGSRDDELSKKILEKEDISTFLVFLRGRKDSAKQRNSGLDSVMARVAKKKGITIGILLDEILESSGKEKAEILARVRQNIELCKKNRLKAEFISLAEKNRRNSFDLKSLGLVLGMPTEMVKISGNA